MIFRTAESQQLHDKAMAYVPQSSLLHWCCRCHLADVVPSLAGYETTANTLAFTTYCLATNPDKAAKLMQVC